MNRLYLIMLAIAAATMVASPVKAALNVVTTSAPAVNYVFSTDGTVTVTDMSSPLLNGGFLQSRIFQGEAGSPAAGKWVYEYRLDLRCSMGALVPPSATSVSLATGPILSYDYNFDANATDHVFVVTAGGLGTVGLSWANWFAGYSGFNFSSPVYGATSGCNGDSSYFWGYTSQYPPQVVTATVATNGGNVMLSAYAPKY
ncbi:MAG TPA: hypothetical protein VJZ76_04615 [Thermoanaerobaculia bacterium]|nr:hypothetical protein [Thermoanaerobaculia bacterium]